ncbi:hypothetical protein IFM89_008867 [Coptis chinensis]|uniref:KOW domain-containing protein n=1 Tax=Coptis chinensis TaxID=261450 RepID=A0A835HAJ4_9MAGN|nr:hypothetical protein IFM89_008867 [Coptis chinensis]
MRRLKMAKFLKPNKVVIVLQGRYAGRKAVIIKSYDDGTRDRPYGHCLVAGISKYPKKATRYTLDVDLKDMASLETFGSRDKKVTAAKEIKARFEERFKTRKNRWFFSKLRL